MTNILIAIPAYGGVVQAECMMSLRDRPIADVRGMLDEFKKELVKMTNEAFFQGLTKKVFAVRQASQNDLKEGVPVVVVRHATHREAATGVVAE